MAFGFLNAFNRLIPVQVWHVDIHQDHVYVFVLQQINGLLTTIGGENIIAFPPQQLP